MWIKAERWVWSWPNWVHYLIAVSASLLAVAMRWRLRDQFGVQSPFVLCAFVVAWSAFAGGIGPGLVSASISLVLGTYLLVQPPLSFRLQDPTTYWQVATVFTYWAFICAICNQLRITAIRSDEIAHELTDERNRLASVLANVTDGFFSVSPQWAITRRNRAIETLLDLNGPELDGEFWHVCRATWGPKVRDMLEVAMTSRSFQSVEVQSEGGQSWYQVQCHPGEDGELLCTVQDITERKKSDQHRDRMLAYERAARSSAEQASRLKDEFLATLSHELRTPLTSLFGWMELIKRTSIVDPVLGEGIEAIDRSARSLSQLIDELLDISRISAGKVRLEFKPLNLGLAVAEALEIVRPAALAKNISLSFEAQPTVATVRADPERLHQVLTNILSNAVKFTPNMGHVKVTVDRSDASWLVTVEDDGQGIDPSFLPNIFERFRQADPGRTRKYGGLGLGLAIARQLVELHGGRIRAESDGVDQGSRFILSFPAVDSTRSGDRNPRILDARVPRSLVGLRITLVEDDASSREVLARLLRSEGAKVATHPTGFEALEALRKECPDVLVSDIGMPDMDGYQLISLIRAIGGPCHSVPAIALTAFARSEDRDLALGAGFSAHLCKPVRLDEMLRTISDLLPASDAACEA